MHVGTAGSHNDFGVNWPELIEIGQELTENEEDFHFLYIAEGSFDSES